MSDDALHEAVRALRAGRLPDGTEIVKRTPVRTALRLGDVFLKFFPHHRSAARREARGLLRARELGLPVPDLLGSGPDWVATRFIADLRPAQRSDLEPLLGLIGRMHDRGMLHGDLHLGNLAFAGGETLLLDLQRTRFWPRVPGWLRRRERGYFAYSVGEPLPPALSDVRRWRDRRAHTHWASRTRRCLRESSGFTRGDLDGVQTWRRRELEPDVLAELLADPRAGKPIEQGGGEGLWRSGEYVLKQHRNASDARRAWIAGQGLEARGIPTGRALAWSGAWLVMQDAGPTLGERADAGELDDACAPEARALADDLGELQAALHRRGIYHADLKANNIAWTPGEPLQLLDYGRVHFSRRVSRRRRVKNLAQTNAALPDRVRSPLRERALARYLARAEQGDDPARLRRDTIAASLARQHRWTGCER